MYQHQLTGTFHKLLGKNTVHDNISLYSLSWLHGGVTKQNDKKINGDLDFPQGTLVYFGARSCFKASSPILAKSKQFDGAITHYTYADPEADEALTKTLHHKMDIP